MVKKPRGANIVKSLPYLNVRGSLLVLSQPCAFTMPLVYSTRPDDDTFELVWQNKHSIRFLNKYSRGSVVVFRNPYNPNERMVKRLIAVGGDWVRPQGDKYKLTYVPRGCCWVEGDNFAISGDSNHFGPIPLALIEAKVTRVLWPLSRAGPLNSELPEVHQHLTPEQDMATVVKGR
ncbi:unnamed protein product [Choristocarpus tenellus]